MKKCFFTHLAVSLVLLIFTFVFLSVFTGTTKTTIREELALFPYRVGKWQGFDSTITDLELEMTGVDDYLIRRYSSGQGTDIWVYVGYYEGQRDIVHPPRICIPASGWTIISKRRDKIHFTKGPIRIAKVNKYLVEKGDAKDLVVYWYHSAGRVVANEYLERLYLIWDSITKKRSDGALVRVYCSADPDEISSWRHLVSFVQEFLPVLYEHLPDA